MMVAHGRTNHRPNRRRQISVTQLRDLGGDRFILPLLLSVDQADHQRVLIGKILI